MCSFQVTTMAVLSRKAREVTTAVNRGEDGQCTDITAVNKVEGRPREVTGPIGGRARNSSLPWRREKRIKYVTLTTKSFTSPTPPSPIIRTYIAYASESGTAQALANRLNDILMQRFNTSRPGYKMFASQVVNVEKLLWVDAAELLLFLVSTTGEGDPPRNGRRFYDNCLLFRYFDHIPFDNVHFAVLGLGSRLYKQNFCAFGVNMDRMAGDLGGTRILPVVKYDTGAGEGDFYQWVEQLLPCVEQICRGHRLPHVVDNSTVPPGVTEKDIMGEFNQRAEQAGVTIQVVTTTEGASDSRLEMDEGDFNQTQV